MLRRLLLLALALSVSGCAHLGDGARRVIEAGDKFGTSIAERLADYDHTTEISLAQAGKTDELAAFRKQYDEIRHALDIYQAAMATGEALVTLYEAGERHETDVTAWISSVYIAGRNIQRLLETMGAHVEVQPP